MATTPEVQAVIDELVTAHDLLALNVEYDEGRYYLSVNMEAPGAAQIRRAIELLDPASLHRVEGYNNANKVWGNLTGKYIRSL